MLINSTVDAILPAGGRIRGRFAAEVGTDVKALISLGGRTLLERTLAALGESGRVRRAVVIGPDEVAAHPAARAADAVLPDTGSPVGNIFAGLEWLRDADAGGHADRVLIMTTDLPFLQSEAVSELLDACSPQADISIPIIRREEFESRFPRAPRRYVRLRDGDWLIGGCSVITPGAVEGNRVHIARAFRARKSVLALAWLLGARFLVRCVFRRITLADIERRCGQILHCTGRAVRHCAPELAHDIDRHRDYRYAVAWVGDA